MKERDANLDILRTLIAAALTAAVVAGSWIINDTGADPAFIKLVAKINGEKNVKQKCADESTR